MKRIFAASVIAATVSFASFEAVAQERVGDAALGALSGAVFFGPVGAVAGAMVGYTTGPSIARAWGMRGHRHHHRHARHKHARPHKHASHGTKKANASTKSSAQTARAGAVRPVQALE
jgi:hypothetical protein